MDKLIFNVVAAVLAVLCFSIGRYVLPKVEIDKIGIAEDKLYILSKWAKQFCSWAKEFMKTAKGKEKMADVVKKLKEIADEAGIKVTEEQLQAIAQTAYDELKAGWDEAEARKEAQQATAALEVSELAAAATPIVNVYTNGAKVAVATDEIKDGLMLEENEDGTADIYNATGEKVGTLSKEEVEEATQIDVVIETEAEVNVQEMAVEEQE